MNNNTHEAVAEPESIVPETDQLPMEAEYNNHSTHHSPTDSFKLVKVEALLQANDKNDYAPSSDAVAEQILMTKHNVVGPAVFRDLKA